MTILSNYQKYEEFNTSVISGIAACVDVFNNNYNDFTDECIISAILCAIVHHNVWCKQKNYVVEENKWRPLNNIQVWSKWVNIK